MPVLKNSRHERFAQLVAGGMPATPAYKKIYKCQTRTAETSSSRLMSSGKVADRIAELKKAAAEKAVWSLAERLKFLQDCALVKPTELTPDSPLCQGIRIKADGNELIMPDKLKSVELYSKLSGDFTERVEVEAGDSLLNFLAGVRQGRKSEKK